LDVLPAKVASPGYTAIIDFVPTPSVEVEKLADPPLKVLVARTAEPCLKVTVSPFAGGPRVEVTVAVNVTACP
jgi:hypothetical protein